MLTLTRQAAGGLVAAALLIGGSSAGAAVVYDNGPLNGTIDAFAISGGIAVSDSFTLAAASTITGVNFGAWTFVGDTVSTLAWGIATSPTDFSTFVAGGTATVVNGTATLNATPDMQTSVDSFSTGTVKLGPGVYYLVLQDAIATGGDQVYWDENNGPSSAISSFLGSLQAWDVPGTTGSESFQVLGSSGGGGGAVPEPAAWVLMLVGFGMLGAAVRPARAPRRISACRLGLPRGLRPSRSSTRA